jgi:hypothetical protein
MCCLLEKETDGFHESDSLPWHDLAHHPGSVLTSHTTPRQLAQLQRPSFSSHALLSSSTCDASKTEDWLYAFQHTTSHTTTRPQLRGLGTFQPEALVPNQISPRVLSLRLLDHGIFVAPEGSPQATISHHVFVGWKDWVQAKTGPNPARVEIADSPRW